MAENYTKVHRQQMCERLLTKGAETLNELDILEILLFARQPRRDTKRLVKIPDPAV